MKNSHLLKDKLPLGTVLRNHMHGVVISVLLTWILSAGIVVTTLMTATFLQKLYGYTPLQSLAATSFGTLFLMFGTVAAGAIVDRIGSGRFFAVAGIFFGVATFVFYTYAGVSLPVLFALYAVMGLSVGMVGAVPYVMVRAFPAPVRFSGLSFSYNVSYAVFGGLTPVIVTSLLAVTNGPRLVSGVHRRSDLRAWPLPDGPQRSGRRRDRSDGAFDRDCRSTAELRRRAAKAALSFFAHVFIPKWEPVLGYMLSVPRALRHRVPYRGRQTGRSSRRLLH